MKQAQLISIMSTLLGVEEKTIRTIVRNLRESGLFTTGARGVNAPDMTPLDAVRVFIAAVASTSPGRAVQDVKYFGSLQPDFQDDRPDCTADIGIHKDATLEDFFLAVVENRTPDSVNFWGIVEFRDNGRVSISVDAEPYAYQEFYSKDLAARSYTAAIMRSAESPLATLHEVGFEMIGWEVD